MQKIFLISLFLLVGLFQANAQNAELIKGAWQYEDVVGKESMDSTSLTMVERFFGSMTFDFNEDGFYQAFLLGKDDAGEWKLDEKEEKILIVSSKGDEAEIEIKELTADKLVIKLGKGTFIMVRSDGEG